jgi:hypothetical protein
MFFHPPFRTVAPAATLISPPVPIAIVRIESLVVRSRPLVTRRVPDPAMAEVPEAAVMVLVAFSTTTEFEEIT